MIVKSQSPEVTIPEVSITDYVLRHADRLGDKPALVDGPTGRTLTYRQLRDGVRRVAAGLAARGFKKGDVLAIYSPNLPEYGLAMLGAASMGAIVTTANPLYTADELAKQLVDSGARLLVTAPPFLDKAKEAAAKAGGIEDIFVFGDAAGARPFAELMQHGEPAARCRHRPAQRHRRAAVLERHHGPAQGRDADALQPGGESLPVRGHAQLRRLQRSGRHHRGAAVLSHLRHGRDHDAGARQWRHRHRDAALRPPGVPRARPEVPDHDPAAGAAHRARSREASARGQVRPLARAAGLLGRRTARRGHRA